MTGARGDFVGSLGRRVEGLRVSLRGVEQNPSDSALRNALLRRVHALGSASRVLGFASVAEALAEIEKRLRRGEFAEIARSLDLLPSLVLGMPVSRRAPPEPAGDSVSSTWPLSVLIFGAQPLADAIQAIPGTHVECERTEDVAHAREHARRFGPDLAIIDADRPGAGELVEAFAKDPLVEPASLVVIGDFATPEASSAFIALGAARVLSKPVSLDTLQRTVIELRAQAAAPRASRAPLGDLAVEALADRISGEIRRGLLESVDASARTTSVDFGDGADVMAAVWGAVARVRELVTLHSSGAVRFDSSGPEGAVPIAAWSNEERRVGQRGSSEPRDSDDVTLQGRRIVVADDDPAVVWFMSGLLKALGVEVLEAHDGARALELTYEAWPDLVVSDVLMPKLDGFSLCHEIKRDVAVRDVPVILLSWKEDLLQRVRELGGSADGYLRKEAAASTVAERLREVLRPRARVERRIASGGDARGRLDGLTPRLILQLASVGQRDVRVGIRDAVYLYEVQIRRGRLCAATRSSADGSFERGEFVLAALLGVSAGRFVIEPDVSPCRADFDGSAAEILKQPIERSRRSLASISAEALVGVTRVHVATRMIEGYQACTPEPARGLLQRVMAGASPRDLIVTGSVAPHLLEAVLSDVARRGGITHIERVEVPADEAVTVPPPPPSVVPPSVPRILEAPSARKAAVTPPDAPAIVRPLPITTPPSVAAAVAAPGSADDPAWFSLQIESAAPAEVSIIDEAPISEAPVTVPRPNSATSASQTIEKTKSLPFNSEVTPSVDNLWDSLTEGVFNDGTLQGVGSLPVVSGSSAAIGTAATEPSLLSAAAAAVPQAAEPVQSFTRVEELDALATALTSDSPSSPVASAADVGQVATAVSESPGAAQSSFVAGNEPSSEPARSALTSDGPLKKSTKAPTPGPAPEAFARPTASATKQVVAKTKPLGAGAWLVRALLAFLVSYAVVSYFRANATRAGSELLPSPAPAASR